MVLCFEITIETSNLYDTYYSKYQESLLSIINEKRGQNVTFKDISNHLNSLNLFTPYGHKFTPRHVWSIYMKGNRCPLNQTK